MTIRGVVELVITVDLKGDKTGGVLQYATRLTRMEDRKSCAHWYLFIGY
jgi:hypothetical protein